MKQEKINELVEKHGRWTKTTASGKKIDRIYFDARDFGLEISRYKTGNISHAKVNGEWISNAEGRRLLAAKSYYDLTTDRLVIDARMEDYFGDAIRAEVAE